ncbi:hypothetical protein F5051DRAFT_444375 [Lentinula edodes]|nr:hypothetical protein F5051DRAFT_444375 [Lentinula edodes]
MNPTLYSGEDSARYHNRNIYLHSNRFELTTPKQPNHLVARLVLPSTGPQRTTRRVSRASPYQNRSPSPDPRFYNRSSPELSSPTSGDSGPSNVVHIQRVYHQSHTSPGVNNGEGDEHDRDSSIGIVDDDSELGDPRIPKPAGEVSRPGRGGYNLQNALNWPGNRFINIKKFIDKAVEENLDTTKPFTKQLPSKIEEVQTIASKKYPCLDDYRDNWVTNDFIKCHLKYRKQAIQKERLGEEAQKARGEAVEARRRVKELEKELKVMKKKPSSQS